MYVWIMFSAATMPQLKVLPLAPHVLYLGRIHMSV